MFVYLYLTASLDSKLQMAYIEMYNKPVASFNTDIIVPHEMGDIALQLQVTLLSNSAYQIISYRSVPKNVPSEGW